MTHLTRNNVKWRIFILCMFLMSFLSIVATNGQIFTKEKKVKVHWLSNKDSMKFNGTNFEELKIFCFEGKAAESFWPNLINSDNLMWLEDLLSQLLSIGSFWSSAEMKLNIKNDNYNVYVANNVSMVQKMHKDHTTTWFYSSWPGKSKNLKISPFESTCAGVLTREPFKISLQKFQINFIHMFMTGCGIALFFYAPVLCRNPAFHYATGMSVGVFLSLVVVSYLIQRRFALGYWAIATYTLSLYLLTSMWFNMKIYFLANQTYVLGYLIVSAAISFAICYRMGPIENPRSINLIQWTIQSFALGLIYISSYLRIASSVLAGMIMIWSIIPSKVKSKIIELVFSLSFPTMNRTIHAERKIHLLSEEEYLNQSRIETRKALENLRDFCQSPKCDSWKITSRLESPSRFAQFVKGSDHITDKEVFEYSKVDFSEDDFLSISRNDNNHSDTDEEETVEIDN